MDWMSLARRVLDGRPATREEALAVLRSDDDELLALLDAAFLVRRTHFGRGVQLHLIRNAKSGLCREDCSFCGQARGAGDTAARYPLEPPDQILAGAREAKRLGAMRYCIVTSGRLAAPADLARLCEAVRLVKREVRIEICTSLGLLEETAAVQLKAAGVDRYNHNLESSERFYPEVCSTHGYHARVETARTAKAAGMALCCGGIVGMGETLDDRVDLALATAAVSADSVPVNFFNPRPGTPFADRPQPSAADGLRALAMFRLVNPRAEIRAAGGREVCLGPLQPLALYPASSIFTNGYLTTSGQGNSADLAMIAAAGFHVGALVQG
jgi:biotin synthase